MRADAAGSDAVAGRVQRGGGAGAGVFTLCECRSEYFVVGGADRRGRGDQAVVVPAGGGGFDRDGPADGRVGAAGGVSACAGTVVSAALHGWHGEVPDRRLLGSDGQGGAERGEV